jgi:hypothetical protein
MAANMELSPLEKSDQNIGRPLKTKRLYLLGWCVITALIIAIVWPYFFVKIEPGHVGVLYRRFSGGTELHDIFKEGTHAIFPWDIMHSFDVRVQNETYKLTSQNNVGQNIDMEVTILFHLIDDSTPLILVNVGEDYIEKIIKPVLQSSVVNVVAAHGSEELLTQFLSNINDEILSRTVKDLGSIPIMVDNIMIRKIEIPKKLNFPAYELGQANRGKNFDNTPIPSSCWERIPGATYTLGTANRCSKTPEATNELGED